MRRSVVRTVTHAARTLVVAAGLLATGAGTLAGQSVPGVRLGVRLSADSTSRGARVPVVRSENLLADGRWLSTLRSGLPVRLHYRLEIWRSRGGWLDLLTRQTEWDVVVRHEPLLDQYTLLTLFANQAQERRYATVDALSAALAFAYQVNVGPTDPGGTTTPRCSRSRPCRTRTSTSWSGFWKAIWGTSRAAGGTWAMRWAAGPRGSC